MLYETGDGRTAALKQVGPGFWRRHWWLKWVLGAIVVALAAFVTVAVVIAHRAEPILRAAIISELENHFHARVELDRFHIALRSGLWADGKGLRIWPPAGEEEVVVPDSNQTEPPARGQPLIRIEEFQFHTPLHYDPNRPIRISSVQLKGLDIDVPPRSLLERNMDDHRENPAGKRDAAELLRFQIENMQCNRAHLAIESNKPGKPPLEFAIARFRLTGVASGRAMGFEAELTNPRPVGTIHTQGSFGPWLVSDPGESPIAGDYRFERADLSTFRGIAGILSSTGRYTGTLRDMDVNGETDTPDFRLTRFGTALRLHTKFHAIVDGTNGDTRLSPVDAVLDHSRFRVRGRVVRVTDSSNRNNGRQPRGHDIALTMDVDDGRVEDFLRLVSHSGTALLTGMLAMKGDLDIPPGTESVERRLRLTGTFTLNDAKFTSNKVQDRIGDLSKRGLGLAKEAGATSGADVRSTMSGSFQMRHGVVSLAALQYTVPGAVIDLKGTYGLEGGALNFTGTARMQATVSQMVGGWKGLLLKPLDRYFKRDGAGTEVPIHINGTRDDPHFGVDLNRLRTSSPERPNQAR